jgi:hypothetical protein
LVKKEQRKRLDLLQFEPAFQKDALEEYERNIISLASLSQAHGIKALFTTQPMLWKENMLPEEQDVIWMALYKYKGITYQLPTGTSAMLLEILNQILLKVCENKKYDCLDLATLIPRTLDMFYDDVHFNENGAKKVAGLVKDSLILKYGHFFNKDQNTNFSISSN